LQVADAVEEELFGGGRVGPPPPRVVKTCELKTLEPALNERMLNAKPIGN
jgi:hypothetical protein